MMMWLRRGLLVLLLILSLLFALLFSHQGNALLIRVAKNFVPQLQLELQGGTLLFGPQFSAINWQNDDVDIQIEEFSYSIDWGCFSKAICINDLKIKGVTANFHPVGLAEPAPSTGLPETLSLPLDVRLKGVDISDVIYQQPGLSITLEQFLFSAQVNQQGATITPVINGLTVKLTAIEAHLNAQATGTVAPKQPAPIVLPNLKAPLPIHFTKLSLSQFTLDQNNNPFNLTKFNTSISWVDYEVTIADLSLESPELSGQFNGQVTLKDDWPLSGELSAEVLKDRLLDGQLNGQKVQATASGDSKRITTEMALTGPVKMQLVGWLAPLSEDLDHKLDASWKKLQWPLVGEPEFTLRAGSIKSRGNLDKFKINLAALLAGNDIPDVDLSGAIEGDLKEIQVKQLLAKTLSGEVTVTGKLNLVDQIDWQGKLELANIDSRAYFPDYPAQLNGQIVHKFTFKHEHWQLAIDKLDVHGMLMNKPLKVSGKLAGNDKLEWQIDDLVVINGLNQISAKGKIKKDIDLLLNVNIPNLANSVPDLRGRIMGKVKVAGKLDAAQVNVDLTGNEMGMGELSLENLTLQGNVRLGDKPSGDLTLNVAQLKQPGVKIDTLQLIASGTEQAHQAKLTVSGKPVSTELTLTGRWHNKGWQGQLQQAWFETIEGRWQLQAPGQISYLNEQVTLGEQCWSSAPSLFCIKPTKAGTSGEAGLVVEHYELNRLQQFLPDLTQLTGVIKSEIKAKWVQGAKPTAEFELDGQAIKLTLFDQNDQPHPIPITRLRLTGLLDKAMAKLVLDMDADQLGKANVDLTLQPYTEDNHLQGHIIYKGLNIDALHYLLPDLDKLAGDMSVDIKVDGPLKRPIVKGGIILKDADIGGGSIPILFSDMNVEVKLNGTNGTLDGHFLTGDGKGKLGGAFNWQEGLDAWLTMTGEQIEINYLSQVQLFLSPDLKFTLSDNKMALTGKILVPRGEIVVKSLPPNAVAVSDDVVVIDTGEPVDEVNKLPLRIKLGISLGDDVTIDAFGLQSHLKGQLAVTKKTNGPVLTNGDIRLRKGTYRAFGQNLIIKKGLILFSGPPDQPYLSVNAIRDPALTEDNVTAGIKLEGPVSAPEITIYSKPAMDQQNALSYLLRGKAIDAKGGDDDSMLTSMLINLGVGQSEGTVNKIGDALGVKELALDSTGSGDDSQLNISGYILPGVQIRYGVGLFTSMTEIALRYEVMPKLYIEIMSGLNSAFDIYYEFDWE